MAAAKQLLVHRLSCAGSSATLLQHEHEHNGHGLSASCFKAGFWNRAGSLPSYRAKAAIKPPCAVPGKDGIVPADDGEGVSLGTVKLPANIDITRFEALLFQWGNSLCQGAMLPLPVPLKVDKVEGGVRLGFIGIDDGATELLAYIDCLVTPATASSGPVFRAIRNGRMKNMEPPGEQRIMRSLLGALQKSVQIAQL